jgi:hypothetical protein
LSLRENFLPQWVHSKDRRPVVGVDDDDDDDDDE